MSDGKRLTLKFLQREIREFVIANYKNLLIFTLVNFVFLAVLSLGLGGVGTLWSLLWGVGYYMFYFVFFRWYFKRTPYLLTRKFFNTLLPALRILFMFMLGFTLLAFLPYLPLLLGVTSDMMKNAITVFIGDFMGESNIYNIIISLILLLLAPVMVYRPMLGWIASVIGRSGSLQNIFRHTAGYSLLFLKIMVAFYLLALGAWLLDSGLYAHYRAFGVLMSPVIVLFNVTAAKTYELLFLD